MTDVSCLVLRPFFQIKYTTSLPLPSSSQASMDSMSSSQDPAGGLHFLDVAGGLVSAGWRPFFRDRFAIAAAGAPLDALPRFFPRAAFSDSSKILSRPPMPLKYSRSTSDADSLRVGRREAIRWNTFASGRVTHMRLSSGSHVISDFFSQPSHLTRNFRDPWSQSAASDLWLEVKAHAHPRQSCVS